MEWLRRLASAHSRQWFMCVRWESLTMGRSVGRPRYRSIGRYAMRSCFQDHSAKPLPQPHRNPHTTKKQQLNNHTARTLEESGWAVRQPWPHCASGPLASEAGHETATTTTLRQAAARRLKLGTIVDARQLHKWTSLKLDAKAAGGWCGGRRGGLVVVATAAVVGDRIGWMVGGQWRGGS